MSSLATRSFSKKKIRQVQHKQADDLAKMFSQGQELCYIHEPPKEAPCRIDSNQTERPKSKCTVCLANEKEINKKSHPFISMI